MLLQNKRYKMKKLLLLFMALCIAETASFAQGFNEANVRQQIEVAANNAL